MLTKLLPAFYVEGIFLRYIQFTGSQVVYINYVIKQLYIIDNYVFKDIVSR